MKKIMIAVALYLLFGTAFLGMTIYGLIMWAEEVEMFY